jgi:hypothetical protein
MRLSKRSAVLAGCLAGAAALAGCTVETGVSPPPPIRPPPRPDITGSLTVRWTIAGSTSPLQCAFYRVDGLSIILYDAVGTAIVSTVAPCERFAVTIDIAPGLYHADATLVDADQRPRSLTLPLKNLRITTGTNLNVDVEFPARSML